MKGGDVDQGRNSWRIGDIVDNDALSDWADM